MKKIMAALFAASLACAGLAILPGCGKCGEKKECREKKRKACPEKKQKACPEKKRKEHKHRHHNHEQK